MAKFIKSAHYFDQYPIDKQFEICVIGRSNVGKSSLINALANKLQGLQIRLEEHS